MMVQENLDKTTKQKCKIAWDILASEYYSSKHRTSRNFDNITRHNLPNIVPSLYSDGLYLDLGGGRGRLYELFPDHNIIVGDFSLCMLKANHRFAVSPILVQMDAFNIPFDSGIFDAVFSLLGDSYLLRKVFGEANR